MTESATLLDPTLIKTLAFALAVGLAVSAQRAMPLASLRASTRVNLLVWISGVAATALACGSCTIAASAYAARAELGVFHAMTAPLWLEVAATVAALDLVSYGWHRANHRIAFFWRFHRVHHSDRALTVSTAARFHPGELLLSLPLRLAGVVLLGAPLVAVVIFEAIFTAFNFFQHGNIRLPSKLEARLGRILIVPALHRRHHSVEPGELNSNYGTIFSLWDRMFRSFRPSGSLDRFPFGLPGQHSDVDARRALLLPLDPGRPPCAEPPARV